MKGPLDARERSRAGRQSIATRLFVSSAALEPGDPADRGRRAVHALPPHDRARLRRAPARLSEVAGGGRGLARRQRAQGPLPASASRVSTCRCRAGTGRSRGSTGRRPRSSGSTSLFGGQASRTPPTRRRGQAGRICARATRPARTSGACAWSSGSSTSASDGRFLIQVAADADEIERDDRAPSRCALVADLRAARAARWSPPRWSRCASACSRWRACRPPSARSGAGEADRIEGEWPDDLAPLAARDQPADPRQPARSWSAPGPRSATSPTR